MGQVPSSKCQERGFSLLEVLVAIVVLALTMVTLTAGFRSSMAVSNRDSQITQSVDAMNNILFAIQSGERSDLVQYGGRQRLGEDLLIEIKSEPAGYRLRELDLILWQHGQEIFKIQTYALEGGGSS